MVQILHPDIYQKAKAIADKKYAKPSAYKSGFIQKKYKEMGGQYADDGTPKNLKRWFKEDWKDVAGLDYPVYRPTKKVSSKTPLTPSEIEPASLVEQSILKQAIKGKSNLPPFKKRGGKRTANEIKDFISASYQNKPPEKIDGWILDKELSTDTAKVYYNPQSKEAVVAHRGTKGMMDWGNNLAYALGYYNYTPRYKKGKSVQDKAEAKYGKSNISTLGHSQGAILSRKLGADTKEVINVNPAWIGEKPYKNEYNIRSELDPVSALYYPISKFRKQDINIPAKSYNLLEEHKTGILDRLGNKEIGVGADNKISNNNIMSGRRYKKLGYTGEDIDWFGGGAGVSVMTGEMTNKIGKLKEEIERLEDKISKTDVMSNNYYEMLEDLDNLKDELNKLVTPPAQELTEQQLIDELRALIPDDESISSERLIELFEGDDEDTISSSEEVSSEDVSSDDELEGGNIGIDQKIKQLVYLGMPQEAVALLLHTGNLETIWNAYISGNDIKPLLSQVLSSLEPRRQRGSMFDLNVRDGVDDEDPLQEVEVSEPLNIEDGDDELEGGSGSRRRQEALDFGRHRRALEIAQREMEQIRRNNRRRAEEQRQASLRQRLYRAERMGDRALRDTWFDYGPNSKKGKEERRQYELRKMAEEDEASRKREMLQNEEKRKGEMEKMGREDIRSEALRKANKGRDRKQLESYRNDFINFIREARKMSGGKVKNPFKKIGKAFSKAGDTLNKGFAEVGTAVNPMTYALKDKGVKSAMIQSGEVTNDYLLPAVVSAGKPLYDATAMGASTMLTGNPILGKAVADTMWNEMVGKQGYDPRQRQKSKELGELSNVFGQAASKPLEASLGGVRRMLGGMLGDDDDIDEELASIMGQMSFPQADEKPRPSAVPPELKRPIITRRPVNPIQLQSETGKRKAQDKAEGKEKKGGNKIDFDEMKWGSFTRMFKEFKKENPRARVKDLEAFAKRILKNKSKFSKRAVQKANFYLNVILNN